MTIRNTLLASGAALLLSAGAAIAAPATAQTDLSVRAGPGVQYPVVGSIQGGETVDVGGCTGSWCQVSFSGGSGYANRSYLAMAGGPGVGIAAEQYYVGDPAYAYDDSDYGYAYGPGVGFMRDRGSTIAAQAGMETRMAVRAGTATMSALGRAGRTSTATASATPRRASIAEPLRPALTAERLAAVRA